MAPKRNETLELLGKKLRGYDEDLVREPLPHRWVQLIQHLNEQEQQRFVQTEPESQRQQKTR